MTKLLDEGTIKAEEAKDVANSKNWLKSISNVGRINGEVTRYIGE
jgi:hypothetical protein